MARRFAQVLRRQISLNHLCQAARSVVHNPEISAQMLEDWISVDLNSIIKQTLYSMGRYRAKVTDTIVDRTVNLLSSLKVLINTHCTFQNLSKHLHRKIICKWILSVCNPRVLFASVSFLI